MSGKSRPAAGDGDSERRAREVEAVSQRISETIGDQSQWSAALRDSLRGAIPAGVLVVDGSGRVVEANVRAQVLLGADREQLLGERPLAGRSAVHEDGSPLAPDDCPALVALRTGSQVGSTIVGVSLPEGERRWLLMSASPVLDPDSGAIIGAVSLFLDATEQKRVAAERREALERELWESDARFRQLLDSVMLGIALIDVDHRFVLANPTLCQMLGYAVGELTGRDATATFHPDDVPGALESFARLLRGEIPSYRFERRAIRKDGGEIWLDVTGTVVYAKTGEMLYSLSIFQDITDCKRAESEHSRLLREVASTRRRLAQFEAILANTLDGVLACDREGRITAMNGVMRRLFGLPADAIPDRRAGEYLRSLGLRHADGRPIAPSERALSRALRGETVRSYAEVARSATEGRDLNLLVSASPLRDENGEVDGAVMIITDVTRTREVADLKEKFLTIAAHELKTPVSIVKGYAQALLRMPGPTDPRQRKMLDAIVRGSGRIDGIVRDLLDLTRLREGKLSLATEPVEVDALVAEVVGSVALTTADNRIRIVAADPAVARCDRARLEDVLISLLDNAIKFSPGGGDVEVAVRKRPGEVEISVTDHGVGIPREKQRHIFEPFYSAHTGTPFDYGGMGIGLSVAKGIVERHGGRMWFESEEGRGSTFHVTLPAIA